MADFSDFDWGQKETEEAPKGAFADFDWSDETTPELKPTEPTVEPEVVKDVTAQPVGRPSVDEPMAEVSSLAEKQRIAREGAQQLGLSSYATGDYGAPKGQLDIARAPTEPMTPEGTEAAREFIRTEALPATGAILGLMAAPYTGGASFLAATALTAGATGIGAGVGEATEQTAKMFGVLGTGEEETAPKDAWDVFERSAWRAGEEAAWSVVPDVLLRGLPVAKRKLLTLGGKPSVDATGKTLDIGKASLVKLMKEYAQKEGLDESKVILASDIANVPLFNASENIAANSYIAGSKVERVRGLQAEAIKGRIEETVGQYMDPALGYVQSTTDDVLARYIEPNLESLNDFGVAGLVNVGFKKAQDAQKSVARSIYKTIGELMDRTTMKTVYREVELPITDMYGNPMTTMQNVSVEVDAFPVDLTGVKAIAEEKLETTLLRPDATVSDLMGLPDSASYASAADTLIDLKATSRSLDKSTSEDAGVRKLSVDRAIRALEDSLEVTMKSADEAGIVTPDGRSLYELKSDADAIWKEQVEDFQNSYIMNIIKNTNPKNGAPDKLGRLFMQNETASRNIIKVLNDAKGNLTGDALEQITQAENAIKGSIVQELFMPFDSNTGKYVAPDVSAVTGKAAELKRMFGEDSYKELKELAAIIEEQSGGSASNYLGFAQRARESGMVMTTIKGMSRADFGPLFRDGGSTLAFALGAGRIITKPKNIKYAKMLANPKIPEYTKIGIFQNLMHQYINYQQAIEATATPDEVERAKGREEDDKEYKATLKGIQ